MFPSKGGLDWTLGKISSLKGWLNRMCREVVEPPSLEGLKGVDVAFGDIWFGGGAGRVSAMASSFWRSFPALTIPCSLRTEQDQDTQKRIYVWLNHKL